jgi:hypothetical protein
MYEAKLLGNIDDGKALDEPVCEWDIMHSPTTIKAAGWQVGTRVVSILEVAQGTISFNTTYIVLDWKNAIANLFKQLGFTHQHPIRFTTKTSHLQNLV